MAKIMVQNTEITVLSYNDKDYISLTDMANGKQSESRAADIIKNWIRTRYTIEFLGTWEMIHNPNFKVVEFDHFKMQAGLPSFTLSASEWIEKTNAIGIIVKKGRYGGTYAFKDIAFEFGTAISVTFKLYLIEEFQRLKADEQKLLGWTAKRELSKINYRIHTDAIKSHLIPDEVTKEQANIIYAEEADVLNVAMFGMTAKQWREANPELKGNIILLRENGFPKLYKPSGEAFDACAKGVLLQISPWEFHYERRVITREQCLHLNAMAERIADNG